MKSGIIEEIKARVSCPEYMRREHGSQIRGGRCKSFRPEAHNTSSLMVNERDWYDFGSGYGGDVIDLAAHDKFNGDKGAAIRYLAESYGIRAFVPDAPKLEIVFRSYLAILDKATEFYQSCLRPEHREYLRGRGLTDETVKALRIGWADNPCPYLQAAGFQQQQIAESGILSFVNRLMVPYLRNGRTTYLIGRASVWKDAPSSNPDAKYMKLFRNELSEHPIWGFESLRRPGEVIVAEGIFDAISCWQENYAVVTAVTGAFSAEQKKDLFPALRGRDVIVCMDYDPETHAGQKFTATLADELFEAGVRVSACFLSGAGEKVDLSSLYAAEPCRATLEKAFSTAKPWEKVRIEAIADLDENERRTALAAFLRRCATVFDWPTVAQLISDAARTGAFADVWLKELGKTLNKAPAELSVVEDFKKKFDCVYHPSLGWYEYDETLWVQRNEWEIRQKIAQLFGRYRTARNVDGVFKLLKAELVRRELFDMNKELLNFPNGMFNIETREMLPHSRDYYSSIQMSYPYDPNATCPKWTEFLEEVTNGDLGRHNILQEMFGYCLTKDVRYQKCFCLIGDGANGKSVLLTVLEAMVGSDNTSHIEIAFLNSDFQRIKLFNSLVNVCNDMKTDVSGTESFFKAIVAGDPINGCYKGEDFVDFRPFCKMVFSANRMLTAREVDYSFLRRFCFVEFPVKFVDEPKEPNERKRNPAITDDLLKELPGIFNWALQGLKILREQGRFTETGDQTQLERELITMANPLISFIEEVVGNGAPHWTNRLNRQEVYNEYNQWCQRTNTLPMSARSFWPRLRTLFPYTDIRTAEGRFVQFTHPRKYCGDNCGDEPPQNTAAR